MCSIDLVDPSAFPTWFKVNLFAGHLEDQLPVCKVGDVLVLRNVKVCLDAFQQRLGYSTLDELRVDALHKRELSIKTNSASLSLTLRASC